MTGGAQEPPSIVEAALAANNAGLSVIPIKPDGSKRPKAPWAPFQDERPSVEQIRAWFAGSSPAPGLAVIGGAVSGHLEMLEFEGRAVAAGLHKEFRECAEKAGLGEVLDRIQKGLTVESPTGGYHLPYRCPDGVGGNDKLARRPATPEELAADPDNPIKVLLETRGEGGYFVTVPSNGTVHATGKPWALIRGGFDSIATITGEERRALLALARTFDRMPRQESSSAGRHDRDAHRPGDAFNALATWAEILVPHGWTLLFTAPDGNQHWRRPGKTIGTSATVSDQGDGPLYVFTTSTAFEDGRAYSKFGAYALLEHGGDFSLAAKALVERGFGEKPGKIGHDGQRRSDQEAGAPHPLTDIANGQRFVAQHGENVRYNRDWRRWLVWDGRRWRENAIGPVEALAKQTAISIWDEAKSANSKELSSWAIRSQSTAGIHAMLEMAHSEAPVVVETKDLDTDPWLLNTPSGTLDLRTGELSPARRSDLITKVTTSKFDAAAGCPRWERFLEEVFTRADYTPDRDLIDYAQRLVGYSLTGSTGEQVFGVLHGSGRNGKGVFTNTIHYMLGDYGGTMMADLLMAKRSDAHPTGLANLFGKRLVVSAETDAGRRLDEALVKNITGSDPISTRRMHEDFWEFVPQHKLLLATNHKPEIRGTDEGIWRRIHCIQFKRTFAVADQDPKLEEKLREEWPGILAWAVRGSLLWQAGGLRPPDAVVAATAAYRQESDAIRRFVEDRCEALHGAEVRTGALFAAYQAWCEAEGERPVSGKAFGADLTARGFPADTGQFSGVKHRIRRHIRLVEE